MVSAKSAKHVIEAVAGTATLAKSIWAVSLGPRCFISDFPTESRPRGNLAFPYSPSDFDAGEVFEFSIYHLMLVDDPTIFFPTVIENIGDARGESGCQANRYR
ncbi:hypothetical protein [Mesorhizobium sp. AR07]|uniref:hypothetical protein n=1 Tax=Mesorhizobium sp. AR07 TaxID=2865838 RepID=UPI0039B6F624